MNVYLAGNGKRHFLRHVSDEYLSQCNILESFYYRKNDAVFMQRLKNCKSLLLDSGAFTFLTGVGGKVDWDKYVEDYAAFINLYDIQLFFELDIDSIVGINEVERLTLKLERLTNKKPIPVWHIGRGKDYFVRMCERYPYVALGGVVIKEIPVKQFEAAFPWFIRTAHEHNCKIHGLGYTRVANLKKYHFDSVDSTAWLYGNRGGYVYKFNPTTGLITQIRKNGCRVKTNEAALHNFNEWVKFSKYAYINY